MSDQKVNELSTATPALTDYIMGMSGTAEYKALVSAVAKKIVEDYAGSTLAGSAQSVKSALDALNSNSSLYYTDTNSTEDGSGLDAIFKASFARVFELFAATSPTVNRAYQLMVVTSGSANGTFVGEVNVTNTAFRFLLCYNNVCYSGQYVRSSKAVTMWRLTVTAV